MLFLAFNNIEYEFTRLGKLIYIAETLPTTSQKKLIDKKKFAKVAPNETLGTFIEYVLSLEAIKKPTTHPF